MCILTNARGFECIRCEQKFPLVCELIELGCLVELGPLGEQRYSVLIFILRT